MSDHVSELIRTLVCGPGGVGKFRFIEERAAGYPDGSVWCISADPGTPPFGPPAAVSVAQRVGKAWAVRGLAGLASLDAIRFRLPLVEAVRGLAAQVPEEANLFVLAPGVSRGDSARELVAALARTTTINRVVVIGTTDVDRQIPRSVIREQLDPLPVERSESKGARRRRRTRAWEDFMQDARTDQVADVLDTEPSFERERRLAVVWDDQEPIGVGWVVSSRDGAVEVQWGTAGEGDEVSMVVLRDAHVDPSSQVRTLDRHQPKPDVPVVKRRRENGPFTFRPKPRIPIPFPTERVASARLVAVGDWFDDPMFVLRLDHRKRCLAFDLGEVGRLPTRVVHELSDVFVTHAHLDHVRDFLWLIRKRLGCRQACRLYGPTGFARRVRHMIEACTWDRVADRGPRFRVAEYDGQHLSWFDLQVGDDRPLRQGETVRVDDGVILRDDRFVVRAEILDHGIPVLAYAVEEAARYDVRPDVLEKHGWAPGHWLGELKAKASAGQTGETVEIPGVGAVGVDDVAGRVLIEREPEKVVYASDLADTEANRRALVDLAEGATVFICEAAFRIGDEDQAERTGHLTTRACGEIAVAAGVEHLVPFHPSARYQDDWEELLAEVREACPQTVRGFREIEGE